MPYQKLSRKSGPRRALLRGLVTSFLKTGRIETTEAKAAAIRSLAEKMITLAKKGDLHARRQVLAFLLEEDVVTNLFEKIGPKMEGREGGYTRVVPIGPRRGDAAPMVILELVSE
jgi:large subunit ribosomal protein L17